MTEDYKNTLLNMYTNGEYEKKNLSPVWDGEFQNIWIDEIDNTLQEQVRSILESRSVEINVETISLQFLGTSGKNESSLPYMIFLAGYYADITTLDYRGAVVIVNEKFEVEEVFTHYNESTIVSQINSMIVDDDGLIYFLARNLKDGNRQYSIKFMNNFTAKNGLGEFTFKSRQSYTLDSTYSQFYSSSHLYKNPNSATFIIYQPSNSEWFPRMIQINIPYGEAVEYKTFTGEGEWYNGGTALDIIWGEDEFTTVKAYSWSTSKANYEGRVNKNHLLKYTYTPNSSTGILTNLTWGSGWDGEFIPSGQLALAKREGNTDICVARYYTAGDFSGVDIVMWRNETFYASQGYYGDVLTGVYLYSNDNNLFAFHRTPLNATQKKIAFSFWDVRNNYEENIWNSTDVYDVESVSDTFVVLNQFNLYFPLVLSHGDTTNHIVAKTILEYDDEENRTNENILVPNRIDLKNSENIPIFSRNLYNKTITNNITTSSVQVPNAYINNEEVNTETLVGMTQLDLSINDKKFKKNIFEQVIVNVSNILNVINRNNNQEEMMPEIANKVTTDTNNLSTGHLYTISKYRINYSDNTNQVVEFTDSMKTYDNENNECVYNFGAMNPTTKSITSIDLLNASEDTILLNIPMTNLTSGKYYKISQKVSVV